MTTPSNYFSWLSFLLGFAIALWIALVLLFNIGDDDEPQAVACSGCCCHGSGGWPQPSPDGPLYIPSGNEPYTCANNDIGGGIVQDIGGGIVQDIGGGIVQDGVPQTPVPTSDTLGSNRGEKDFECGTNDIGGGIVQDSGSGRSVVLPMQRDDSLYCANILGYASVLQDDGGTFNLISYDKDGNLYEVGSPVDTANKVQFPSAETGAEWAFCTVVPDQLSDPKIVDQDNQCIAGC